MQTIFYSMVSQCELQELQLVAAARSGDATGLVEYLYLKKLPARAVRLASGYRAAYGANLDAEDLVMIGVELVLRILGKALEVRDPIGWLLAAAQRQMQHYCEEYRSQVRVPRTSQRRGHRVPRVVSLDAPLAGCEDLTLADLLPA